MIQLLNMTIFMQISIFLYNSLFCARVRIKLKFKLLPNHSLVDLTAQYN